MDRVHNILQEVVIKTIPKKKKCKKTKWLSDKEGKLVVFTKSRGKKRSKKQGRKGKVHPTTCRVLENSKDKQEGLLQ